MVKMTEETKPARRAKRSFTDEFKAGAVRLVEGMAFPTPRLTGVSSENPPRHG